MTWEQGVTVVTPRRFVTTAVAPLGLRRMTSTGASMWRRWPAATTSSRHASHIIPGPRAGYSNSSISDVTPPRRLFGASELHTARPSDRFLIRCAAQSAWMAVAGTPQTFSVYVLKNVRYRRQPNRAAVQ